MSSSSTGLPTPEGPGSVSGAPNLPAGFTGTFKSVYVDIGKLRLHAVIGGDGPPLLLVHGWPETWYAWRLLMLALARDFSVVAVDRRGIGLSDKPEDGYDTGTLANDLAGLMDALGIRSAHLVGASMGGMIAQEVAITFPERVRSLTSIMSTTGNPKVPPATREAMAILMAPPPTTREEFLERFAKTWKVLRVGSFPEDEALDRARAERTFARGLNPAGAGRQLRAILASGSRKERLRTVKAPTLVIHGTVDPLVRPEGGKDTAASIPGAKLLMVEGMGHALPILMWPQIIDAIDRHAHAASAQAMHS